MPDDNEDREATAAREAMEAARLDVVDKEKKIQTIKEALKRITLSANKDATNSLSIAATKITGLPPSAEPSFHLQLSSPIEELTLSSLHNPEDDETNAVFRGVETNQAMLTIKLHDKDICLGSSSSVEVAPWCTIEDPLKVGVVNETEVEVEIFGDEETGMTVGEVKGETETKTEGEDVTKEGEDVTKEGEDAMKEGEAASKEGGAETPKDETKEEEGKIDQSKEGDVKADESKVDESKPDDVKEPPSSTPENETTTPPTTTPPTNTHTAQTKTPPAATLPVATITFKIKYTPSPSDERDELYLLLNKTSKLKAAAMEQLRKCATAVSRTRASAVRSEAAEEATVKSGFLNRGSKAKEEGIVGRVMRWYEVYLGPKSFVRRVFPAVKNYGLFFGVVALMHFKGQELALPPPV